VFEAKVISMLHRLLTRHQAMLEQRARAARKGSVTGFRKSSFVREGLDLADLLVVLKQKSASSPLQRRRGLKSTYLLLSPLHL
jgi:hypothetical protein